MKSYYFFAPAAVLTILTNLVGFDIIKVESGEIQLALVLMAGIGWGFTAGFISRRFLWIPIFVSVSHVVVWFLTSLLDTRTFFGGAMMRIISAYGWSVITVILLVIIFFRFYMWRRAAATRME